MLVRFVYKIFPAFIQYTDDINKENGGQAWFMFIKIRPKYKNDKGIHEHELTHVKQCYRLFIFIHGILYRFSERYRLRSEIEAYVNQIKINLREGRPSYIDYYVERIGVLYNIRSVSSDQIRSMIDDRLFS